MHIHCFCSSTPYLSNHCCETVSLISSRGKSWKRRDTSQLGRIVPIRPKLVSNSRVKRAKTVLNIGSGVDSMPRTLPLFQVDAFTDTLFEGNPAAVCLLEDWLPDDTLLKIAAENNLAETSYILQFDAASTDTNTVHQIRWFTPEVEVDLCGHATLATAHVVFNHLGFEGDNIRFSAKGGEISVIREAGLLWLDFPSLGWELVQPPDGLLEALGVKKERVTVHKLKYDYMVHVPNEGVVKGLNVDLRALKEVETRGVIVTSRGDEVDFVSRFFGPRAGIDEDSVTGSAHCTLAPFWGEKLEKTELVARQISPRGGKLWCRVEGDRVKIGGHAVTYLEGTIRY